LIGGRSSNSARTDRKFIINEVQERVASTSRLSNLELYKESSSVIGYWNDTKLNKKTESLQLSTRCNDSVF
jgi:hypothetical protein